MRHWTPTPSPGQWKSAAARKIFLGFDRWNPVVRLSRPICVRRARADRNRQLLVEALGGAATRKLWEVENKLSRQRKLLKTQEPASRNEAGSFNYNPGSDLLSHT